MKFISRILPLFVVVLLLSASCVCPVVADDVSFSQSDVPSLSTSQALREMSVDENNVFYVFTLPDGRQGIVHERVGVDGLSRIEDITLGDQCAVLLSDTPEEIVVGMSGGYLLTFEKSQQLLRLEQYSGDDSSSSLSVFEPFDADVVVPSENWLSKIISSVPLPSREIVDAGLTICLSSVNPVLGAGYFVSTCLVGSTDANPVIVYGLIEAAIFVTAVGAIALVAANGRNYGSIDLDAIQDFFDDKGVAHFVVMKDNHFYKYQYDKHASEPHAEYLGEVNVVDGVITMAAGEILKFNGAVIKYLTELTEDIVTFMQDACNHLRERLGLKPVYYRLNGKYNHRNNGELSFAEAKQHMKDCGKHTGDDVIWIGSTKSGCKELAKKATEEMGGVWEEDKLKEKSGNQPWHYHANSPRYQHCNSHCFWDYVDFFKKVQEERIKKGTNL